MTIQDIIQFIQGVGFPIFVAVYLLVWFSKSIQENTIVLRDLKNILEVKLNNGGQ